MNNSPPGTGPAFPAARRTGKATGKRLFGVAAVVVALGAVVAGGTAIAGTVSAGSSGSGVPGGGGTAHAGSGTGRPFAVTATPPGYSVTGIDVSSYQNQVSWSSVHAAGAQFAYAKATEGLSYVDPQFAANNAGAKGAGVYFGAYHFGRPDLSGGTAQADYFLDHARYAQDGHTLPPMLDIEWPYKSGGVYVAP